MAGLDELTVRLRTLEGQWETVGADRLRGIVPEHFGADSDEWGPATCSFQLRRDPGAVHPDLTAFTRCRVWVDGLKVWSGRVKETPSQDGDDRVINVAGLGMQYHLDDDVYERAYVHTRLADWKDWRSRLDANLAAFTGGFDVQTGDGGIVITNRVGAAGFPAGGVFLDLGPTGQAARVVVEWECNQWAGSSSAWLGISDDAPSLNAVPPATGFVGIATLSAMSPSSGVTTVTAPGRYLLIACYTNTSQPADRFFRVKAVRVFTATAYESGGVSVLTADDVVNDALDRATLLLSADRSEVKAGTFPIDDYALTGARTPRERVTDANAYENYETKIDVEDRMCFRPRASAPVYEIGEWSGAGFADGGSSGDDVHNRVLVEATGPDGAALSVDRVNLDGPWLPDAAPSIPNFGFETNTTGWTANFGTITRDTAVKQAGLASGRMDSEPGGNAEIRTTISGLTVGAVYLIQMDIRRATASLTQNAFLATGAQIVEFTNAELPVGTFVAVSLVFRALTTSHLFQLRLDTINSSETSAYVDNVRIFRNAATLVDRHRFRRTKILPINSAITEAIGDRFGDLFLDAHRTTPFRGDFNATGRGGIRKVLGGATVHPAWLLRDTGQLVRCTDRVDPDTGGWGRKGRIVSVKYDHDTRTAVVSLDDNRAGFETLLARYSVIVGAG